MLITFALINILTIYNLSFFGLRIYKIGSGSMEPSLKVEDIIIIKENDNYKENDIITYKKDEEYITHRIISIKENIVITKGDANNTEDDPISKQDIVGKYIYKFKILGKTSKYLSNIKAWIIILIFGFIITLILPSKKD